jgi:hypothetical protein
MLPLQGAQKIQQVLGAICTAVVVVRNIGQIADIEEMHPDRARRESYAPESCARSAKASVA